MSHRNDAPRPFRKAVVLLAALWWSGASAAARAAPTMDGLRPWTVEAIAAAPQVVSVDISVDGKTAMYIVRHGDLARNAKMSALHKVDIATGADQLIATSAWLSHVQAIPGSSDWSLIADLGAGAQLYRLGEANALTPLVVNPAVDAVGSPLEGPQAMGVSDYGWAPDGKRFWYERRNAADSDDRIVNPLYSPVINLFGVSPIELHVRSLEGADALIDTGASTTGGFFYVAWQAKDGGLAYWRFADDRSALQQRRWSPDAKSAVVVESLSRNYSPLGGVKGPNGGDLTTQGFGAERRLIEGAANGRRIDYGAAPFRLGDPRASKSWLNAKGDIALAGTRTPDASRYGLIRVKRNGGLEDIPVEGSLTHCAINAGFTVGVCVQESMTSPPTLVKLDPRAGGVTLVAKIAPDYEAIAPLRVEPRKWTNRNGYVAGGFLVYPRDYTPGRRYPAILVNHGNDADDTFVNVGFQWDYPVQAWAERGYFVVAMNESSSIGSAKIAEVHREYSEHTGTRPIAERQDLIWINDAHSNEDAIKALAAEGLVDSDRVGIAGYSYGSQVVNVTMTQTKVFRAASSGDGGFLEPSAFPQASDVYTWIYGGSPFDPAFLPNYHRMSPTMRAGVASGAVLQQVASGSSSQLELHLALRRAGKPSEWVYYPGESHLFHQPKHRIAAMTENLDWFDFWLLGKEDADPAKAEQYRRWRGLRAESEQRSPK